MDARNVPLGGRKGAGRFARVSEPDYDRVIRHKWHVGFGGYPGSHLAGRLHQFVFPRPSDVPAEYVLDHANRDVMDATRPNLRYVSLSFNAWNTAAKANATSKWRGVSWSTVSKKWVVVVHGKRYGGYEDERVAAWVAAKEAIREWPLWAPTSDLLVGPELFSPEDITAIQAEIASETVPEKPPRKFPKGVELVPSGKYRAYFRRVKLGLFATVAEAEAVAKAEEERYLAAKLQEHKSKPIPRDADGHAVIALTGGKGAGIYTKVPDHLWHDLTFGRSWNFSDRGYAVGTWEGDSTSLHIVVYKLLHPNFTVSLDSTVNHIVSSAKLDNRAENLEAANQYEQGRNKAKRAGGTSTYIGVSYCKSSKFWVGTLKINGEQQPNVSHKVETECARLLDALEFKHLGSKARVRVPAEPAEV